MSIELKMPALSPTMEKGTLAKWLVAVGDVVKPGDLIAEIEADKATMELEATDEGRISRLVVPEGTDEVAVGTVIAVLAQAGETPIVFEPARDVAIAVIEEPAPVVAKSTMSPGDRTRVSPLVRRVAEARGLDVAGRTGTGAGGRVVLADLGMTPPTRAATATVGDALLPAAAPIAPPPATLPVDTVKLSAMRRTVARRLSESKQTVPHFYLTARCRLDPLLALRQDLNAGLSGRGIKISVNDMLIKALALALLDVPDANVQFGGDSLHRFSRADISMAVALDDGLVTPVIQDAGALSLSAIAVTSKALAAKARDGKLRPEDYEGGTASISNLGMFGVDEMFPVINPPQALILGVAAGIEQPWKVDGQLSLATIMAATASFDHRAIDGAVGARFMQALRDLVENPARLIC